MKIIYFKVDRLSPEPVRELWDMEEARRELADAALTPVRETLGRERTLARDEAVLAARTLDGDALAKEVHLPGTGSLEVACYLHPGWWQACLPAHPCVRPFYPAFFVCDVFSAYSKNWSDNGYDQPRHTINEKTDKSIKHPPVDFHLLYDVCRTVSGNGFTESLPSIRSLWMRFLPWSLLSSVLP